MMQRACDRILHTGLVLLCAFTPFAFGTVEPWSVALMEWGIVSLALVFALSRLWPVPRGAPAAPPTFPAHLALLGVPIGLFLVLCALQTLPVPMPWLRVISPGSARQYEAVDLRTWMRGEEGESENGQVPGDPLLALQAPDHRPISVNPAKTRSMILLLTTLLGLFFMVACWADEPKAIALLRSLVLIASLVALFGVVQLLTWNGKIYWVRKIRTISATAPAAFGPFVNHDHFAGYVEMVIPVAISLAFWVLLRKRRTFGQGVSSGVPGSGFVDDASGDERSRVPKAGLAFFAAIILIVSLFLSLSRGGILSALISGSILLVLLCRRLPSRALRWTVLIGLPLVVALLIAWIGARGLSTQLESYANPQAEASFRLRAIIWGRVLRELPAFPILGSGLGTFEDSFSPLTPAGSAGRWDRAHNDYLQLAWETGAVGGLLFLAGASLFVWLVWWPALREYRQPADLIRIGMSVSILSIAIHSLVDFCLQIGANGFLCALLAGLLVALQKSAPGPSAVRVQPTARPGAESK